MQMNQMNPNKAAKMTSDVLVAIETWTRRTFFAALAVAILAGFVAIVAGLAYWDYQRTKQAMSRGMEQLDQLEHVKMPKMPRFKFPD